MALAEPAAFSLIAGMGAEMRPFFSTLVLIFHPRPLDPLTPSSPRRRNRTSVILAKAGIHRWFVVRAKAEIHVWAWPTWIPAVAGMTNEPLHHHELQLTEQACNGYWEF